MTDLYIPRKPYGALLLEEADRVAIDFFENDISSVDPGFDISFDDRAAQAADLDGFEEVDVRVLQRGMRLARTPRATWDWLKSAAAPLATIQSIPHDADLVTIPDAEYQEVRQILGAALTEFVSDVAIDRRGPAVATKILHLRRPRAFAICDRNVMSVLGVHLPDDSPTHEAKVSACLETCDLVRQAGRRNLDGLASIRELLLARGKDRPLARILDALLWLAY